MSSLKSLVSESAVVQVLGELVQAYEVAYVAKIGRTRDEVIMQREFVEGLRQIYNEMKLAYRKEVEKLLKKKGGPKWLLGSQRKKSAAVLFSSSRRLAGEINQKVFNAFWDYVQSHECDVIIVGSWARDVFTQRAGKREFIYFETPDLNLTTENLQPVLEKLLEYENVQIFRGKYVSLINQVEQVDSLASDNQEASQENLDQNLPGWLQKRESEARQMGYLFEPSLNTILDFFEREIFSSWLKQTSVESGLAQMGSRIATLEVAIDNIEKRLHGLTYERRKLLKRRKNKRQLQALAGMSFWQGSRR